MAKKEAHGVYAPTKEAIQGSRSIFPMAAIRFV
jgi:hypothetical protein